MERQQIVRAASNSPALPGVALPLQENLFSQVYGESPAMALSTGETPRPATTRAADGQCEFGVASETPLSISGVQDGSPVIHSNLSGEGSRAGIHSSTFGPAYSPALDGERIAKQHEVVRDFMLRSGWKTLAEIEQALGYPQASVSAQLRHLRKPRFGSYLVEKRRRSDSQWEYAVTKGTTK